MEIFDDWIKLSLEILLLAGGLILMGLGRRTDERLTAVSSLAPAQALMQVAQKGRIGFGYPQVGAIAVTLWACLELFGTGISTVEGPSSIPFGSPTILSLLTVLCGIAMLQSRFTLDSVIWLLVIMILGGVTMVFTRDGGVVIILLHLFAVSLGWLASTVSSLALWGVTPLNRMTRPLPGEQVMMAVSTAVLGVIICEIVVTHRESTLHGESIVLMRAGIVMMVLGSWATIAQGIFVRSILGLTLMAQGTMFVVWSMTQLNFWQLSGITFGIDFIVGLLLWWTYQSQFGNRETKDLADERKIMLRTFETSLIDGSGNLQKTEATDGFAVAGR